MNTKVVVFVALALCCRRGWALEEDYYTTPQLIDYWGYESEEYDATTEDGWTLQLFRIPKGKNELIPLPNKPVVILQHGITCASDYWLLNLPEEAPGFVLADAGFDVWIANSRMTNYSSHVNYTEADSGFWRNTADEMAKYDLPAVFDKIEEVTGQRSFHYIGHSLGAHMLFMLLSEQPTLGYRIKKFFAVAPGVSIRRMSGGFGALCVAPNVTVDGKTWESQAYTSLSLGMFKPEILDVIARATCRPDTPEYCGSAFCLLGGIGKTVNTSRLSVYSKHLPHQTSTANALRLCQLINNGGFSYFTYPTVEENIEAYGSETPPSYTLENFNAPIYLYTSPDDVIGTEPDLDDYFYHHINKSLVKEHNHIDGFHHMDFLFAADAKERVYDKIIFTILFDL